MTGADPSPGDGSGAMMRDFLHAVEAANASAASAVGSLIVRCWSADHLVYAAGAGHSLAAVNETFFRAGGLAFVRPVHDPRLFPLNGARASTTAERESGLAADVLSRYAVGAGDVVVIFSNSGINPYPVELAQLSSEAGATVVAVTSTAASSAAPLRAGRRLYELADRTLDTLVPPGDAAWPPDGAATAPLSSLANVFVWNLVLAAAHVEAVERGLEIPMWRSANTAEGESNESVMDTYHSRIPELD
ncbi:putative phosphosugar-binding protein [Haloactinopolyspora alba]|uniref:Putative phosphosugar-binding protein n=1 Tax=Haloactinopolyspora alba TaxID=648780 RepID=A0A2P8DPT7_9ACTN|nr:sugar isomerase domain-containing protein [Haloactinopolyspora alba]PSK99211.1 putative phosphosugar-binding protein [Haloactinopolyspora alba]